MRLQSIKPKVQPEIEHLGPYKVLRIDNPKSIQLIGHTSFDAILTKSKEVVRTILQHDALFLTPIFYDGYTDEICDGNLSFEDTSLLINKIDVLRSSINPYQELSLPSDNEEKLITKLIRYIISRKTSLKPQNTRASNIGYTYPLVCAMSIESNPIHILKQLNKYVTQNYFTTTPIDKINVCYECNGSYLNFSECCTKCNSLDLSTEELVHHFRCAYVGPKSDFVKNEKLVCPKCDHQLKHIGIDYDKPSEIHCCNSCNHRSQETKMKAKCTDCQKENELEQLVTHSIFEYKATEKARSFAMKSQDNLEFPAFQEDNSFCTINFGAFELIKQHESRRKHAQYISSYEMTFSVNDSLLLGLNTGMQNSLLQELSSIIKSYINENDLISIDENNQIHALLIDYKNSTINDIQETLSFNLNKMLSDNGWSTAQSIFINYANLTP